MEVLGSWFHSWSPCSGRGLLCPWRGHLAPPTRFRASFCFLPSCPASSPPVSNLLSQPCSAPAQPGSGKSPNLCRLLQIHPNRVLFVVGGSQAHPRQLIHHLDQRLWLDPSPCISSLPLENLTCRMAFSHTDIQTVPYHRTETVFLMTLELVRSSGNCTIVFKQF